jgi:hypothetical protein
MRTADEILIRARAADVSMRRRCMKAGFYLALAEDQLMLAGLIAVHVILEDAAAPAPDSHR